MPVSQKRKERIDGFSSFPFSSSSEKWCLGIQHGSSSSSPLRPPFSQFHRKLGRLRKGAGRERGSLFFFPTWLRSIPCIIFRASFPLSLGLELEWSVRRRRGNRRRLRRSVFTKGGGGFQGRTWPGQKRKEGAPPLLHSLKARCRGGKKMEKRNSGKRSLEQWLL